jgi:hypothetical protein
MPTKKNPDQPESPDKPRGERGRYARLLADGYVVEVEPVKPKSERTTGVTPRPAAPTT